MKRSRHLIWCSALLALAAGKGHAQRGPTDKEELTRFIDSLLTGGMSRERMPGAAFCFVKDGRVLMCKGYGLANVQQRRRVSADSTIFRIGSISKVVTATALVQLADRGAIDLNADVNRYLNKVRVGNEFPEPVTVIEEIRMFVDLRYRLRTLPQTKRRPVREGFSAQDLPQRDPSLELI